MAVSDQSLLQGSYASSAVSAARIDSLVEPGEPLIRGMWPRSAGFWAACVYIALYIIRPWETLVPELAALKFERVAYLAVLMVIAASPGIRLQWDGLTAAVGIFTAVLAISAIRGYDPLQSWNDADGLYVYLTKVLSLVILVSAVRTPYQLVMLITAAVAVISIVSGKALWEYIIHNAGHASMGVTRLAGINETFGHPNDLTSVLIPGLAWWLALWRSQKFVVAYWSTRWQIRFRSALIAAPVLIILGVLLTGSRAGACAAVLFLILASASTRYRIRGMLLGLLLLTIAWTFMGEANKQRIRSIWDPNAAVGGGEESKQGRVRGLKAGVAMLNYSTAFGVGMGNFRPYRERYVDGAAMAAHNIPGQLLGDCGIIGFLAFAWLVACLFRTSTRVRQSALCHVLPVAHTFQHLTVAFRHSALLLLFLGLASHLAYLFTWLWLAAFLSTANALLSRR